MGLSSVRRQAFSTAAFVVLQLIVVAPLAAAPAYVTDQLRLGVHNASDTSDRPFVTISSGDRVEIMEETQYYARVTIPDGREGWVKKNYLLADKPAVLVLEEVEKARDDALAELEALRTSLTDRESRVSAAEQQIRASEEKKKAEQQELVELRQERIELLSKLDAHSFSVPGNLFFIAAAASVVAGFLVAWWWFDRRSRARHGGFKVY